MDEQKQTAVDEYLLQILNKAKWDIKDATHFLASLLASSEQKAYHRGYVHGRKQTHVNLKRAKNPTP